MTVVVVQEGRDDLPFAHTEVPAYKRSASGLEVPCDGPRLLELGPDGKPACAACHGPLYRTDGG